MATPKRKYGYNPDPRLSANQLSEYLTASPTRRKSIIRDAQFPKTVLVARYDGARDGICRFLADGTRPQRILAEAVGALNARHGEAGATDWIKDDTRLSVAALQAFQKIYGQLALAKIDCRRVVKRVSPLKIADVEISVQLDLTTHRLGKNGGADTVGGVVMLFSKTETSSKSREERCRTASVLAALFAEQSLGYLGEMDHKLCFSLDVFGGRLYQAPGTYKRKQTLMQDSCEEIHLRWMTIEPPSDYDGPALKR